MKKTYIYRSRNSGMAIVIKNYMLNTLDELHICYSAFEFNDDKDYVLRITCYCVELFDQLQARKFYKKYKKLITLEK